MGQEARESVHSPIHTLAAEFAAHRLLASGRSGHGGSPVGASSPLSLSSPAETTAKHSPLLSDHGAARFSVRGQAFMAPPYQLASSSLDPFPEGQRIKSRLQAAEAYADQISGARFRRSMLHAILADSVEAPTPERSSSTGKTAFRSSDYVRGRSGGLILHTSEVLHTSELHTSELHTSKLHTSAGPAAPDGTAEGTSGCSAESLALGSWAADVPTAADASDRVAEVSRSLAHAELWYAFRPWAARALLRRRLLLCNPMLRRSLLARWRVATASARTLRDGDAMVRIFWHVHSRGRLLSLGLFGWRSAACGAARGEALRRRELQCVLRRWAGTAEQRVALARADAVCGRKRTRRAMTRWVWAKLWAQLNECPVSRRAMLLGARGSEDAGRILAASPALVGAWRRWRQAVTDDAILVSQAAGYAERRTLPFGWARWRGRLGRRAVMRARAVVAANHEQRWTRASALGRWRARGAAAADAAAAATTRARWGALGRALGRWRAVWGGAERARALLAEGWAYAAHKHEVRAWRSWLMATRSRILILTGLSAFRAIGRRAALKRWVSEGAVRERAAARAAAALTHLVHRDAGRACRQWRAAHAREERVRRLAKRGVAAAAHARLGRSFRTLAGVHHDLRLRPALTGAARASVRSRMRRWRRYTASRPALPALAPRPPRTCCYLWHGQPLTAEQWAGLTHAAETWDALRRRRLRCRTALLGVRSRELSRAVNTFRGSLASAAAGRSLRRRALACVLHFESTRGWRQWREAAAALRRPNRVVGYALARARSRGLSRALRTWVATTADEKVWLRRLRFGVALLSSRHVARAWAAWWEAAAVRKRRAALARRALSRSSVRALNAWRDATERSAQGRARLTRAAVRFACHAGSRTLASWVAVAAERRTAAVACQRLIRRAQLNSLVQWRAVAAATAAAAFSRRVRRAAMAKGFSCWATGWRGARNAALAQQHWRRAAAAASLGRLSALSAAALHASARRPPSIRRCFGEWRSRSHRCKRSRTAAIMANVYAFGRCSRRVQARAVRTWEATVKDEARLRSAVGRAADRIDLRTARSACRSWRHTARLRRLSGRAVRRMRAGRLGAALVTWSHLATLRATAQRCLSRWRTAAVASVYAAWADTARLRRLARAALTRFTHQRLSRGMEQWAEAAHIRRAGRTRAAAVVHAWRNRAVLYGLACLSSHRDLRRRMADCTRDGRRQRVARAMATLRSVLQSRCAAARACRMLSRQSSVSDARRAVRVWAVLGLMRRSAAGIRAGHSGRVLGDAVKAWRETVAERSRNRRMGTTFAMRLASSGQVRCVAAWRAAAARRKLWHLSAGRILQRSQIRMLAAWREAAAERRLWLSAARRLLWLGLSTALELWRDVAADLKRQRRMRAWVGVRMCSLGQHSALTAWWQAAATERKSAARAAARLLGRGRVRMFPVWRAAAAERSTWRRAACRMRSLSTARAVAAWRSAVAQRHLALLAARRLRSANKHRALLAWRETVADTSRSRHLASSAARRLALAGRLWAWEGLRRAAADRSRARQLRVTVARRLSGAGKGRALRTWRTVAWRRKLGEGAARRLRCSQEARAVRTWREAVAQRPRVRELGAWVVRRLRSLSMAQALSGWRELARQTSPRKLRAAAGARRASRKTLRRGMEAFTADAACRRRIAATARCAIGHLRQRGLASAWLAWRANAGITAARERLARRRRKLRQALARLRTGASSHARRSSMLKHASRCLIHGASARACHPWKGEAAEATWRATQAAAAASALAARASARGFRFWTLAALTRRAAKSVVRRASQSWASGAIRTAFITWLLAARRRRALSTHLHALRRHAAAVRRARRLTALAVCLLHRHSHRAVAAWKEACARRATAVAAGRHALTRLRHSNLLSALCRLDAHASARLRIVSLLSAAFARLCHPKLSHALNGWRQAARDQARTCDLSRRVIKRWRAAHLLSAFRCLALTAAGRTRARDVACAALSRWRRQSVSWGLLCWKQAVADQMRSQRAVGVWRGSGLRRAFSAWGAAAGEGSCLHRAARAVLGRLAHASLNRAIASWCEAVEARHAALSLARTAFAAWRAGDVRRGFLSWCHAAERRTSHTAEASRVIRLWRHSALAAAFRRASSLILRLSSLDAPSLRALLSSRGVSARPTAEAPELRALARAVGMSSATPAQLAAVTPTPAADLPDALLAALLALRGVAIREGASRIELLAAAAAAGVDSATPEERRAIAPTPTSKLSDAQLAAALASRRVPLRLGATRRELNAAADAFGLRHISPAEMASMDLSQAEIARVADASPAPGWAIRDRPMAGWAAEPRQPPTPAWATPYPHPPTAAWAAQLPTAVAALESRLHDGIHHPSPYALPNALLPPSAPLPAAPPAAYPWLSTAAPPPATPPWHLAAAARPLPCTTSLGTSGLSAEAQRWLDATRTAAANRRSLPASALDPAPSRVSTGSLLAGSLPAEDIPELIASLPATPPPRRRRLSWSGTSHQERGRSPDRAQSPPCTLASSHSPGRSRSPTRSLTSGGAVPFPPPGGFSPDPLDRLQQFLDEQKWTVRELFRNGGVNTSQFTDGDFSLSVDELRVFFSSPDVGLVLSPAEARALVRAIDTSGNGEVEQLEMDDALRARKWEHRAWGAPADEDRGVGFAMVSSDF